MKNKTLFFTCLILYLLFVLLIITEPIGYNPILLCAFFFLVFSFLYLFPTISIRKYSEKLPKQIRAILYSGLTLLELSLFFALGWIFHKASISTTNSDINIALIGLISMISISAVGRSYCDYIKRLT